MYDLWSLFGLRESPFFQDTFAPGSPYPTELFVGRKAESDRILRHVASSPSSRQVLHGPPGIGKTTLAQHAKGLLWEENHIVRWRSIAVVAGQRAPALLVDILASVHEAVLTARPAFSKEEPMEAARGLVRSFRQTSGGGGISVLGSGAQASTQTQYVRPVEADVLQEAWRLLLEIVNLACGRHEADGVVVHLNNIENLTSSDSMEEAARTFRDIRDLFLVPGLHWLVVGTSDETLGILGSYPQVRSIFLPSHPPLAPLSADDFLGLLHARYAFLVELRTMENRVHMAAFSGMGAAPTPMAFPEVFGALQQGVVDGQENPVTVIAASKFWEVQKYVSLTGHVYSPAIFLASPTLFAGLTDEQKGWFYEAAKAGVAANRAEVNRLEEVGVELLRENGMEVITDIDKAPFAALAEATAYSVYMDEHGTEMIERIKAVQ
ncbi:MAG: TRAP transporter substrate-binding protein DctP [Candidatus Krumholzibacteriia bacterium]